MIEPADLLAQLRAAAPPGQRPRCCVAFSGGLDSTVLLHLAWRARQLQPGAMRLRAVHVDHHLQPASPRFRAHALRQARRWRVPIEVLDVQARAARGASPEEAAREARYAAFAGALAPGELLISAQHADDQLETVLLALMRGAGPAGLSGMPAQVRLAAGTLLRPLLGTGRAGLLAYAREHGLEWIEDPSNNDLRFDRNFLRSRVLPALRERWPTAALTAARSARHCAELLGRVAGGLRRDLALAADGEGLEAAVLRRWSSPRQRAVLRAWFVQRGVRVPDERRLAEALRMLEARADATPCVAWPGAQLRLYQGRLSLTRDRSGSARAGERVPQRWNWRRRRSLALAGGGMLQLREDPHGDIDLARLPAPLWVCWLTPGAPRAARDSARSLRKQLQELDVPVWEREPLPLLCAQPSITAAGGVVAIADLWADQRLASRPGTRRRARFVWRASVIDGT